MREVFRGRCRSCSFLVTRDDPAERDHMLTVHYRATGHQRFRHWTEDRVAAQELRRAP